MGLQSRVSKSFSRKHAVAVNQAHGKIIIAITVNKSECFTVQLRDSEALLTQLLLSRPSRRPPPPPAGGTGHLLSLDTRHLRVFIFFLVDVLCLALGATHTLHSPHVLGERRFRPRNNMTPSPGFAHRIVSPVPAPLHITHPAASLLTAHLPPRTRAARGPGIPAHVVE